MSDVLPVSLDRQLSDANARLILLHPRFAAQKRLLAPLLREPDTLYLRVPLPGSAGETSLQQIYTDALDAQWSGRPLAELKQVVFDECDHVDDAVWLALARQILASTPARVIILTRRLPDQALLESLRTDTQMRLVPQAADLMLTDYTQSFTRPLLEVQALCAGRVYVNGRPVENWDGLLPRALFSYLVDRGMVTRVQIFETFWPSLSVREATNVFHVTKRKINEVLGFDLMTYSAGFYCLTSEVELRYDVSLFLGFLDESAVAAPEDAPRLLEQALWLYRGAFLSGLGDDLSWVRERREQLRQSYGDALGALGHWCNEQGQPERALFLYGRASAINPQREDLADHMMRLYRDRGQPEDALRVYRRLEAELQRSLRIKPARWLQELAREMTNLLKRA